MTAVHSTTVIFFYVQLISAVTSQACQSGYFSTGCRYRCRCTGDNCDINGSCLGADTCMAGWFGPACQYADIAHGNPVRNDLTDGNDGTCRDYTGGTNSVTLNLADPYPFTWLRVHVNTTEAVSSLQVTFNNTVSCNNPRNATVDSQTWDIYCGIDEFVQSVTLTGPAAASLCSIYISGGRDIAIKETAQQTSTYKIYSASLSVDGKVNPDLIRGKTCSSTFGGQSTPGSWNVTFSQARLVNRYAIYNRADMATDRLLRFSLQSFNGRTLVSNYTNSKGILPVYTVKHGPLQLSFVQITSGSLDKILAMCEIEIYGDSICGDGQYGRECEHRCNCDGGQPCFVSTGGCPYGCAINYQGENCSILCEPGKYGPQCNKACSDHCANQTMGETSCDHVHGACRYGCQAGYREPLCLSLCEPGKYGPQCNKACSDHCANQTMEETSCDHVHGACRYGCQAGYKEPLCLSLCEPGKYGPQCNKACSEHCDNQTMEETSCDHVHGACRYGCQAGYKEPLCLSLCEPGKYGPQCNKACSEHCDNQTMEETSCDHVHGACRYGCQAGYKEPLCLSSCDVGKYGLGCGYNCSSICVASNTTGQSPCHHVTGVCMFGCLGGNDVRICQHVSDDGDHEGHDNGQLIGIIVGCLLGVIIVAIIIGIIVYRRHKIARSETHTDSTAVSRDNLPLSWNELSNVHQRRPDSGYEISAVATEVTQRAVQMGSQREMTSAGMCGDYSVAHTYAIVGYMNDDSVAHRYGNMAHRYNEIDDNVASPYENVVDDSNQDITSPHNCPGYANIR